ncbi:hypothetical protein [Streptomyces sp. NPDC101234]|uniref:hypothetical protein n=1 Tax=Streptomyces sp. NPDC101234 TaxID=3366138 RepID=UPI00381A1212
MRRIKLLGAAVAVAGLLGAGAVQGFVPVGPALTGPDRADSGWQRTPATGTARADSGRQALTGAPTPQGALTSQGDSGRQ